MARISTYSNDTSVVGADKWIGSDSQSSWATKNFTAEAVAEYMNRSATQSQLLRYVYSTSGNVGRPISSISFSAGGADTVAFSTITTWMISQYALNVANSLTDVSTWYTAPLVGSEILITQSDDITNWAIFQWVSTTKNVPYPTFYDIVLTYKSGNGSLTKDKDYFISLLTYNTSSSTDANFTVVLDGNADTYTVDHNLNKYCSVTVTDKDGANDPTDEIKCSVVYISLNRIKLDFETGTSFNGVLICN
jgi:hypothetical protein